MIFSSREDAGERLGSELAAEGIRADLVLGLPRGGVVVAAQVARRLRCPLDVLVVRKVGHPRHREFAVGALAEGEVVVLDSRAIEQTGVDRTELDDVIAEERERLRDYQRQFHREAAPNVEGRSVLIVDDGLATGATTEAAVLSAKKRLARQVLVAVPVASPDAHARLSRVADQVFALFVDPEFDAVGRYYQQFAQTTDDEVRALLDQTPG